MIFDGCRDSTIEFGFDSVKFDGCSEFQNMTKWMASFAAASYPILAENCHNTFEQDPCPGAKSCPLAAKCPFTMWRTSRDIGPSFDSIQYNIYTTLPWSGGVAYPGVDAEGAAVSGPGRWAYPGTSSPFPACACVGASVRMPVLVVVLPNM